MVNQADILNAFDSALIAHCAANLLTYSYNGVPQYVAQSLDIVFENDNYVPTLGRPYLEVDLLTGDPWQEGGQTAKAKETGIYQISLYFPRDEGAADLLGRADLLRQYFQRSLLLSSNGVKVQVERTPSLSPQRSVPDWYSRALSVPYFVYS